MRLSIACGTIATVLLLGGCAATGPSDAGTPAAVAESSDVAVQGNSLTPELNAALDKATTPARGTLTGQELTEIANEIRDVASRELSGSAWDDLDLDLMGISTTMVGKDFSATHPELQDRLVTIANSIRALG